MSLAGCLLVKHMLTRLRRVGVVSDKSFPCDARCSGVVHVCVYVCVCASVCACVSNFALISLPPSVSLASISLLRLSLTLIMLLGLSLALILLPLSVSLALISLPRLSLTLISLPPSLIAPCHPLLSLFLTHLLLDACLRACSFGVLMWVMYRCLPPWVKKGKGYTRNKELGRFRDNSPALYVNLCARCAGL